MDSLKAILFDADGVFQRPPPDLAARLALATGLAPSLADRFILDLFAAEALAETGTEDFFACAQRVLARWELSLSNHRLGELWHEIEVDKPVLALVADLRGRGIYCALASNQQSHRAHFMSEHLGYAALFDAEFYSCHLGHMKPAAAYFEAVIQALRLTPQQILFIDDRAENVEAASRVGIHAALFAPNPEKSGVGAMDAILGPYGL